MTAPEDSGGPSLGSVESWDLDEYTDQVGPWDVRLDKVSSGAFHSAMRFLKLPGITLYDEHWEHHVVVHGSPPEGLVVLGTNLASHESDVKWCGQTIDTGKFACAEGAAEIDFVMPDRGHDAVMLIDPHLFEQAIGGDARERINSSSHIDFDSLRGKNLVHTMVYLLEDYHNHSALLQLEGEVERARSLLLSAIAGCFENPTDGLLIQSPSQREEALHRALTHIEQNVLVTSARETAQVAGIGQRTLELLFREELGTTPGKFLGLARLNHCYHELFHADPQSDSVTEIAHRCGFTHHGRFARAYREHFGELPSRTLGKGHSYQRQAMLNPPI